MENKIRIKCPFCGKILLVKDNPAFVGKKLTCPVCKQSSEFSNFKKVVDQKLSDKTEIHSGNEETASFFVTDSRSGESYRLKEGRNLLGRMTYKTSPKATVPIRTEDLGFSREHLFIEIIKSCDGTYHCFASNASNKNPTYLNGEMLEEAEKVGLDSGDVIKSSETELVFTKKSFINNAVSAKDGDDETQL